jgi:lipopolysaccharide transport system ATP-binding protein
MYVRLAFAVAAHLDSEILIVDEVLAVGDAEFQKKCLGKMGDVSQGEGRTVLFVSHNMAAISSLCTKGMILKNGALYKYGPTSQMINEYMQLGGDAASGESTDDSEVGPYQKLKIRKVRVLNNKEEVTSEIINNAPAYLEVTVEIVMEGRGYDISVELINAEYGTIFCSTLKDTDTTAHDSKVLKKGLHCYRIALPVEYLRGGNYTVITRSAIPKVEMLDVFKYDVQFTLVDITSPVANTTEGRPGAILPILTWQEQHM